MVAKTAEPPPVTKAADKAGAPQTQPQKSAESEDSRSTEHLKLIRTINKKIAKKREELNAAEERAENAKDHAKGLKAALSALYDELSQVIDDPFKGMELFKQKTKQPAPESKFFIVSVFAKSKLLASYKVKANWPNQAREFCERKHAGESIRCEVREFVTGDESLKLTELDATIDPAWRNRPIADLKLAGGIVAKLPAAMTTIETLVHSFLVGSLADDLCEAIDPALKRFEESLAPAQRADYDAFAELVAPEQKPQEPTAADAQPVKRTRPTKLDRELAEGVAEAEAENAGNLNRVAYVRERFAAWGPEERIAGMMQALHEDGLDIWGNKPIDELELSDEIQGKLAKLEVATVADILNFIAEGDSLTKLSGINKGKATLISEALKADWENLVTNHPALAISGGESPANEPQAAAS